MKTNITTVGYTDCKHCDSPANENGHDACLGELPGVANACCGHGDDNMAYIQFWHENYQDDSNKFLFKGEKAIQLQKVLIDTR